MNFSKSLLVLALSGFMFVSCKNETKPTEGEPTETATDTTVTKVTAENLQTASFNIEGMSCAVGCAKIIEKKLAGLEGVQDAKVDFENKTATVSYDAAQQTPETLVTTVEAQADGKTYKANVKSSGDKAMLYKEKEKKKEDKKASSKDDKSKEAKPACCSEKKACSSDEKKAKSA